MIKGLKLFLILVVLFKTIFLCNYPTGMANTGFSVHLPGEGVLIKPILL